MRLRRRLESQYQAGRRDALDGRPPNTGRVEGADGRYLGWAYRAGHQDGSSVRREAARREAQRDA